MSNDRTGTLWVPGFAGMIGVREDGAVVNLGGTELTVSALSNVAGEYDQFVPTSGKVLTVTNTLTLSGTDGTTMTFPSATSTLARSSGTNTFTGAQTFSTAIVPTGGVGAAGGFTSSPRNVHTGGIPVMLSTDGTELTITNTELYVAEVFIPANVTVTGVAQFWGATTDGNAKVMLFNSAGARVAISASTDISGFTGDSYGTRIAFTATYAAVGPATYYVGIICDTGTNTINTHTLGNFGAGKITGLVYATEAGYASITVPTTFTTGLGPIATLY